MSRAIRVFLATGDEQLDDFIANQIPGVRVVKAVYYKEGVLDALADLMPTDDAPEVILIGESLEGDGDMRTLLRDIRLASFNTRVIFIFEDASDDNLIPWRHYLMGLQIYDVLGDKPDGYGPEDVLQALFEPRNPAEVLRELSDLDHGERPLTPPPAPLSRTGEEPAPSSSAPVVRRMDWGTETVPVTAFWSAKGGEGVDTLAINAAVAIAQSAPDLSVCLVDFARTPNLHLHFNTYDEERNFEEVLEQAERKRLSPYSLERYVVEHPDLPNLKILVGSVRTINFDAELEGKERAIETIISVLRECFGCVILILSNDMPGLTYPPTVVGLQKASQILMVVTEDHASFYNARRALDPEYGRLQAKGVDLDHVRLVLNKYTASGVGLKERMAQTLWREPEAVVPLFPEALAQALAKAEPLLLQRNVPPEVRQGFEQVAALIDPRFKPEPVQPVRRGLLSRIGAWFHRLFRQRKGR